MVSQQAAQPQASWLTEAQIRHQPVGSIPYDGGTGTVRFLDLPLAGYLSALQLVTTLSSTGLSATPSGVDAFANAQAALQQVRLFVNTEGEMLDLDGNMLSIVTAIDDQYNNGDGQWYPIPQATFSQNPGTNVWTNQWIQRVPLAFYLKNVPYPLGLYNTALQNLNIRLQVRWLPILEVQGLIPGSGVYVGSAAPQTVTAGTVTGQVDVNEEYFEPIPVLAAQPPLRYIHRWTQFEVPINVTNGVVDVPLPGRQRYLRMIYAVLDGASGAVTYNPNVLTNLQLTYGVQTHPEDETVQQVGTRMRKQYGRLMGQLPGGIYTHDFVTLTHDPRDWFNAGLTTNLRAQLTFSGAHPGTGSKIICATEEMLTLRGAGFNQTAAMMAGAKP